MKRTVTIEINQCEQCQHSHTTMSLDSYRCGKAEFRRICGDRDWEKLNEIPEWCPLWLEQSKGKKQ